MAQKQKRRVTRRKGPVNARKRLFLLHVFSDRSFEARNRAFRVIARMRRDGVSLREACRLEGTTPATVIGYLPAALRQSESGRWIATKSDPYVRDITLPGPHGPVMVRAHGSREAQLASAYLNALAKWARTGETHVLAPFHSKKVGGFELITAAGTLGPLHDAGLLQLDSLYAALKDVR